MISNLEIVFYQNFELHCLPLSLAPLPLSLAFTLLQTPPIPRLSRLQSENIRDQTPHPHFLLNKRSSYKSASCKGCNKVPWRYVLIHHPRIMACPENIDCASPENRERKQD